jgi:hypothetical protein
MMPYQLYQIERARSATEIRRADKQLGLMAEAVSRLWHRVTQPIAAMRARSGTRDTTVREISRIKERAEPAR